MKTYTYREIFFNATAVLKGPSLSIFISAVETALYILLR